MTRTVRLAVALLLCFTASIALARHAPAHAQPLEMSPEEAAIQLQAYVLTRSTAPNGYNVSLPSIVGPASLAFGDTTGASPLGLVALYERQGLVAVMGQSLTISLTATPTVVAAPALATFSTFLMRTPDAAQAVVAGQVQPPDSRWTTISTLGGVASLGDGGVLYDLSAGEAEALEYRWSRGPLAFALFVRAYAGGPAGVVNLSSALDGIAAAAPAIDLSTPLVAPPVSQAERLQALLRLSSLELPAAAIPAELSSSGPSVSTGLATILGSTRPVETLNDLDTKWQRVASLTQGYTSRSLATRYFYGLSEDASAAAQAAEFRDFSGSANPPKLEPAPLALGDDAYLYRTHITVSGRTLDSVIIAWRHGALVLSVQVSDKPGTVKDSDVADFAQAVEDAYQQSAYAGQ